MKLYAKPQTDIIEITTEPVLTSPPDANNCMYNADGGDSGFGIQYANRHQWDASPWSEATDEP